MVGGRLFALWQTGQRRLPAAYLAEVASPRHGVCSAGGQAQRFPFGTASRLEQHFENSGGFQTGSLCARAGGRVPQIIADVAPDARAEKQQWGAEVSSSYSRGGYIYIYIILRVSFARPRTGFHQTSSQGRPRGGVWGAGRAPVTTSARYGLGVGRDVKNKRRPTI